MAQELEAGRFGPVQVVDDDDERAERGGSPEEVGRGVEQEVAGGDLIGRTR